LHEEKAESLLLVLTDRIPAKLNPPSLIMATLVFYLDDGSSMTHSLEAGTTTVGRHPDSVIVLDCPSVSGHHAIIEMQDDGCYVSDQQSSNGTRVNGASVEEAKLKEGDRVGFGDIQAIFYKGGPPAEPAQKVPTITSTPTAFVPPPKIVPVSPNDIRDAQPPRAPAKLQSQPNRRPQAVRRVSGYPDTSESGCATALIVIFLFIAAFITGLYMRHTKETEGGNFFSDVMSKVSGSLPKIKVEK
jgi:pSer/pThr/pTyr-binding forkhead associated (FHA) protein